MFFVETGTFIYFKPFQNIFSPIKFLLTYFKVTYLLELYYVCL